MAFRSILLFFTYVHTTAERKHFVVTGFPIITFIPLGHHLADQRPVGDRQRGCKALLCRHASFCHKSTLHFPRELCFNFLISILSEVYFEAAVIRRKVMALCIGIHNPNTLPKAASAMHFQGRLELVLKRNYTAQEGPRKLNTRPRKKNQLMYEKTATTTLLAFSEDGQLWHGCFLLTFMYNTFFGVSGFYHKLDFQKENEKHPKCSTKTQKGYSLAE